MTQDALSGQGFDFTDDDPAYGLAARRVLSTIDPSAWLSDEEYASLNTWRFSRESLSIPAMLDGRLTDRDIENEDKAGVRFYIPILVNEPTEASDDDLEAMAQREGERRWRKGRLAFLLGKIQVWHGTAGEKARPTKFEATIDEAKASAAASLGKAVSDLTEDELAEIERELWSRPGYLTTKRYWVLTPGSPSAASFAPRRPFFMIPKWRLDELFHVEVARKSANPDELVEYEWSGAENDAELIRYLRTGKHGEPPFPLVLDNGKPKLPRRFEDERGMSLRAHRLGAAEFVTAAEVFEGEEETRRRTRFQESPPFLQEDASPAESRRLREDYEEWLQENYDWWYPSEIFSFRHSILDRVPPPTGTWQHRAEGLWDVVQLHVHVTAWPTLVTSGGVRDLDWSTFRAQLAPSESRRDVVRALNHWRLTKSLRNSRAAGDLDSSELKRSRAADWGGPRSSQPAGADWRFSLLTATAEGDPPKTNRFLGAWRDKRSWEHLEHDGVLAAELGAAWLEWSNGLTTIERLCNRASQGMFPRREELDREVLPSVPRYESEYEWASRYELTLRDPRTVWEHCSGIISPSLLPALNSQLHNLYGESESLPLHHDNCTDLVPLINEMWFKQPPAPVAAALTREIQHLIDQNVMHLRPEMNRLFHGTPVRGSLRTFVRTCYEASDERVWDFLFWHLEAHSRELDGGDFGIASTYNFSLSDAMQLCREGFGLGYGTLQQQQSRQERLMEIGLQSEYHREIKRVINWFNVRFRPKDYLGQSSPSLDEVKLEVTLLVRSGRLSHEAAQANLWPRLQSLSSVLRGQTFPDIREEALQVDRDFIEKVLLPLSGNRDKPKGEENTERQTLINDEWQRFLRVAGGQFFEVNRPIYDDTPSRFQVEEPDHH